MEYLGALRDANIWPATKWPTTNLLAITSAIEKFRIPEYDASQNCNFCYHVEDEFAEALNELKEEHKDRLWGLCMECFKAGALKPGECTYQHDKSAPHPSVTRHCGNASGRHSRG